MTRIGEWLGSLGLSEYADRFAENRIDLSILQDLTDQDLTGEIALLSLEPDVAKAEMYFERALAVARKQQAKSWELRAATSMARLWCDRGKRQQARGLHRSTAGSPKASTRST
jgi:SAM domain (Sterile alpha motif)